MLIAHGSATHHRVERHPGGILHIPFNQVHPLVKELPRVVGRIEEEFLVSFLVTLGQNGREKRILGREVMQ